MLWAFSAIVSVAVAAKYGNVVLGISVVSQRRYYVNTITLIMHGTHEDAIKWFSFCVYDLHLVLAAPCTHPCAKERDIYGNLFQDRLADGDSGGKRSQASAYYDNIIII